MKKHSKTVSVLLAAVLVASMLLSLIACNKDDDKVYKIGICQLVTHDALDAATKGFQDALKEELGEDKVVFDLQNAAGESTTCTTIVNKFITDKVDLIMANATPALLSAYNATSTIPILGTSVTEYGTALGIKNFNGTVGGNVSGTSDLAPLDEQAAMVIEILGVIGIAPEDAKVGLVYCSAEPNSEYQVRVVTEELVKKGVSEANIKLFTFADSNDVSSVVTTAINESDAIYIPTDNTAASCTETIGNLIKTKTNAKGNKVPVIAGESGICKGCGVATLSISYYDLGVKTGKMAAKILKGESKISEMAIEYAPAKKYYNADMCNELGITIPDGYTAL